MEQPCCQQIKPGCSTGSAVSAMTGSPISSQNPTMKVLSTQLLQNCGKIRKVRDLQRCDHMVQWCHRHCDPTYVLSCDFTDVDLTAVLFFSIQSSSPCDLPEVMWLICLSVCLSVKYLYVHSLLSIKFLIQHSCWICIFILNVFLNSCLINFSFSCVPETFFNISWWNKTKQHCFCILFILCIFE